MNTNQNNPRIVEFIIDEESGDIVDVVSIVDGPAIELDFLKFNEEKPKALFQATDEEKRIVVGPAMIPNKYIYRYDMFTNEEFYGYFSEKTIEKAMNMFMTKGSTKKTNLNHNSEFFEGISIVESWQVIDAEKDKAYALGYNNVDVPKGSWMVTFKVDNDDVWKAIKNGEYTGFSIEAFLSQVVKLRKESSIESAIMDIVNSDKSEYQKKIELLNFATKISMNLND